MKHKKIAAMFGTGILTVSGLVGCVYGPDPEHSVKEAYTLDLSAIQDNGNGNDSILQAQENAPERTAS